MFSSVWDVVSNIQSMATDEINISNDTNIIRYFGEIENKIYEADDIIRVNLLTYYSTSSFYRDSYATVPVADKDNTNNSCRLRSVYINNTTAIDPYTSTWFIEITDTTSTASLYKFSLKSSLEGSQGTGFLTNADTTSTNGDATILTAAWENTSSLTVGDMFYFSVIDVEPIINYLSKTLAGSLCLDSIFTEEAPNESGFSRTMWNKAMSIINKLKKPTDYKEGARLPNFAEYDGSSLLVSYKVNSIGQDESPYLSVSNDAEYG